MLALILSRSEAFARHETRFWGRPIGVAAVRGGSQQGPKSHPTSGRSTPTCVMQMPPPQVTSAALNGEAADNNNNKDPILVKNGASRFLRVVPTATPDRVTDVEYVAETKLPTDIGQFQLRAYRLPGAPLGQEPCVIYSRDKPPFGATAAHKAQHVPVRIHDQCLTSEVFRSQR